MYPCVLGCLLTCLDWRPPQDEWAGKLERSEAAWAAKYDKLAAESQAALEEGRREWTCKYYLTEGEWFKKLQLANQDWGEH
jgi:hypothetical protein